MDSRFAPPTTSSSNTLSSSALTASALGDGAGNGLAGMPPPPPSPSTVTTGSPRPVVSPARTEDHGDGGRKREEGRFVDVRGSGGGSRCSSVGAISRGGEMTDAAQRTPHADRIQRLSQKLSGIRVGLEHEKSARDWIREKVRSLEVEVNDMKAEQEKDLTDIRQQIQFTRAKVQATKAKEMGDLSNRLTEAIEMQQQRQQESELRCLTTFEDKTNSLRDELLKDHLNLVDTQSLIQQYCNVEIPKLQESLKQESRERAAMEERILKEASTQISGVSELIERERILREEQAQTLLHLIEQVVSKMQAQLQEEREDRESTERALFQLLEDTITKLDAAAQL